MKPVLKAFAIFLAFMVSASHGWCSGATPLRLVDATGQTIEFNSQPRRIVSLAPSVIEIFHAMDAADKIIAVTRFCPFPEMLKEKENIGTVLNPDIEKIIMLKPDIVFAAMEGNRISSIKTMRKAGLKVFVLGEIRNFGDIYAHIDIVGKILSRQRNSDWLIADMAKRIGRVKQETGGRKPLKVFMQMSYKPMVTVNKDTIINDMIELAGGENISKETPIKYSLYSRETVLINNPDAIIIVSMGESGVSALREWGVYDCVKAVRDEKVCIIDSNLVCNMGPRLVHGLEKIAHFLHPEKFEGIQ